MSRYNDFTTYLNAYGIDDVDTDLFDAKLPKTTLAFASKIQSESQNSIEDVATIAAKVFSDETHSPLDYDQYFIPLTTRTKHFSVHVSRTASDVVVVISTAPVLSLWENSILQNEDRIAVVRISQLFTKPILSDNNALFLIAAPNSIQGVELALTSIPQFRLPSETRPWLEELLQKQDNLIEKAIAYGYIRRFPSEDPGTSLQTLLTKLSTPKTFDWSTSHSVQQETLHRVFRSKTTDLTEKIATITEDNIEEWLLLRDQLQSLRIVLAELDSSTEPDLLLQQMDAKFPHPQLSPHLPQNRLLSSAYQFDPMCWWGKPAKMRELYDRLLHNH